MRKKLIDELVALAQQVAAQTMLASGATIFGKWRETQALKTFLDTAKSRYATSDLVAHIADRLKGSASFNFGGYDRQAPDVNGVMARVAELDTLCAGFPDVVEVKRFFYDLAEQIANASGEGLFGTGERINSREAIYLQTLRQTLGL
jgi:hypothetical protein